MTRNGRALLATLGALGLVGILVNVFGPPGPGQPPSPPAAQPVKTLIARVHTSGDIVEVTNPTDEPWADVHVAISDVPLEADAYRAAIGALAPAGTVHVALNDFADHAGRRFNPFESHVRDVEVDAVVHGDRETATFNLDR